MNSMTHTLSPAQRVADPAARSGMLICPKCRTTYSSSRLTVCYRDGERLVDYDRFVAIDRDPLRGAIVGGKYRLVERIGQGGMGTVYRAVQIGLNRNVAVKILKRELNLDRDTVARFHREANAMSLLAHPNTVRVYDFGQTEDGLLYLVMELLVGELITERMARSGPLDVLEAVRVTQQILRSLAEAHSKAIVHRDLKPDNVFMARVQGHEEPVVKVLDFGIAKVVAPDRRVDQFETQAGTVFGTPRYMSPEQAQGAALDGRSDLYTVGTLLYQMLVGHAPFTDDDAVVVMAKHIREQPTSPTETTPERPIPGMLNDVVMRALEKDPSRRFQDASEFELALEACVPEIVAAQRAVLTGRWPRRQSRRVSWLYGVCAVTLFGAGYFGVRVYAKLNPLAGERVTAVALPAGEPRPGATPPALPVSAPVPLEISVSALPETATEPSSAPPIQAVDVAVQSEPSGATVYRDGERIGETPLALEVPTDADFVRIELRMAGYQPLAAELTARDGTRLLTLTPLRAKRHRRAAPARAGEALGDANAKQGAATAAPEVPANLPTGAANQPAAQIPAKAPTRSAGPYERFE